MKKINRYKDIEVRGQTYRICEIGLDGLIALEKLQDQQGQNTESQLEQVRFLLTHMLRDTDMIPASKEDIDDLPMDAIQALTGALLELSGSSQDFEEQKKILNVAR